MKKLFGLLLALLLLCTAALALSEDLIDVEVELTYRYDMTECMLDMINEFRTGGEAWIWDSTNTDKELVTGLSPLIYDKGLEHVAMLRAAECAVSYSHTRPSGKDTWSAYPAQARGENIAAGYRTTEAVYLGWREDDEPYSGQGHRRNMLSTAKYIGIGCVYADGTFYWCQAFGNQPGSDTSVLTGPAIVEASIAILKSDTKTGKGLTNLAADSTDLTLNEGESTILPKITAKSGGWGNTSITLLNAPWTPADPEVLSVSTVNKTITSLKGGKTTLTVDLGTPLTVNVVSVCQTHTWDAGAVKTPPTCTEAGVDTFTCILCGTQEDRKGADATGHDWADPTYAWSDDFSTVTASHVCKHDASHSESEPQATSSQVLSESTCLVPGRILYTSNAFVNPAFKVQQQTVDAPLADHTLALRPGTKPTCTEPGVADCWECSVCHKLFSDEAGTTEIAAPAPLPATGHDWSEPEYVWADDSSAVTASRICANDPSHKETETVGTTYEVIQEPTTSQAGIGRYTSDAFKNEAFTVQTRDVEIAKYPKTWKDKSCKYAISDNLTAVVTGLAKNSVKAVTVPDTITVNGKVMKVVGIKDGAFKGKKIKSVKIGKNVTTIGKNAFYNCGSLTSVTGMDGVTTIKEAAFRRCVKLAKITLPAKLKTIGAKAFYDCKALKLLTIKTKKLTAKTVGAQAFTGTPKKMTCKCPSGKKALYKKVLTAKGVSKTAVFK